MSEALDALEAQIESLTPEQQEALEAFLKANVKQPESEAEAVAIIPEVQAAIQVVAPPQPAVVAPVRNSAQTIGAVRPLQPLER